MTLLKKFWWVLLILAAVCFFLWKGCKAGPDHSGDKKAIDSLQAVYTAEKKVDLMRIDSLIHADSAKDIVIDALVAEKVNMQKDLSNRGRIIDQTIKQGQQARQNKDTAAIISNCDSLRDEVIAGKAVVGGYEVLTDSLIKDETAQLAIKDALISNWKGLFLKCDTTQASMFSKYNSLYSDYQKDQSKIKFLNVKTKIGVGLIAALVAGILLKK
jgi:hypothetical protein